MKWSIKNLFLSLIFLPPFFLLNTSVFATDDNSSTSPRDKKYPLDFLLYSDFSFKNTNFLKNDYNAVSGWSELRLVFDSYSLLLRGEESKTLAKLLVPNPYFKSTFAASSAAGFPDFTEDQIPFHHAGRIARENSFVYGIGMENRFFQRLDKLFWENKLAKNPYLDCIRSFRFYGEHLELEWWAEETWQSDYDNRFGIDLWYEWNVPGGEGWPSKWQKTVKDKQGVEQTVRESNKLWGEIWMNGDWRKTNFFINDYDSWTFGSAMKLGIRAWNPLVGQRFSVHVMPYVTAETSLSGKNEFFWENRLLAGGGIRVMPKIKITEKKDLLLRIYAEHVTAVDYFEERPDPNIPWNDIRAGINFSINRH